MLIDYHMHGERDEYRGKFRFTMDRLAAYVETARRRGIHEIAMTEHVHRFREFRPIMEPLLTSERARRDYGDWLEASFGESLDEYTAWVIDARDRGLPVKLGLEVDWVPGCEQQIAEVLRPYPWDVVLGSVHFLGTWCIDYSAEVGWPEKNVDDVFQRYYRELAAAAGSGLFDVLAHPDLVKKFGHRSSLDLTPMWRQVARAAARGGCCVEVSTAGLSKPVGEIYPSLEMLAIFKEEGVPITLASDAHGPEEVGRDVQAAVNWARRVGYEHVAVFERRQRRLEPLG